MNKKDDQKLKTIFKQYKTDSKNLGSSNGQQIDKIYQKIKKQNISSPNIKLGMAFALVIIISIGSFRYIKNNQISERPQISESLPELEYDSIIEEQESFPIVDDYILLAELI